MYELLQSLCKTGIPQTVICTYYSTQKAVVFSLKELSVKDIQPYQRTEVENSDKQTF